MNLLEKDVEDFVEFLYKRSKEEPFSL